MPQRAIGDDVVAQAARLRGAGLSFKAIGKKLGIDPRTAKSSIEKGAALDQTRHWESVEQRLDARYLEEHYRLLLYACAGLMQAIETDILGVSIDADVLVSNKIERALIPAKDLLVQRGILTEPGLLEDPSVPIEVIHRLREGLMEHEPGLAQAVNGPGGWVKSWRRFQVVRRELIEQARGLLSQKGLDTGLADQIAEEQVRRTIQRESNDEPSSRDYSGPGTREEQYDLTEVLRQVSHPERLFDLEEAAHDLAESVVRVREEVRGLQIRGRPSGRCGLCPSKSQGLPPDIVTPSEE